MRVVWRTWHHKGYWQRWEIVPEDGVIQVPVRNRTVQIVVRDVRGVGDELQREMADVVAPDME